LGIQENPIYKNLPLTEVTPLFNRIDGTETSDSSVDQARIAGGAGID